MAAGEFTLDDELKKKKAALEQQHGREVVALSGDFKVGVIWCTAPTDMEVLHYMTEQVDSKTMGIAQIELMNRHLIEPSTDYKAVFGKRFGAMVPYSQAYAKAVGITADAAVGK